MDLLIGILALLAPPTPAVQSATKDRDAILGAYARLGAPTLPEAEAAMRVYYAQEYTDYAEGPPPTVWPFWPQFESSRRVTRKMVGLRSWYGVVSLRLKGDRAFAKVIVYSEYRHLDYGKMRRYTGSVLRDDLWRKRRGRWQIVETRHKDFLSMTAHPPVFQNEVPRASDDELRHASGRSPRERPRRHGG